MPITSANAECAAGLGECDKQAGCARCITNSWYPNRRIIFLNYLQAIPAFSAHTTHNFDLTPLDDQELEVRGSDALLLARFAHNSLILDLTNIQKNK